MSGTDEQSSAATSCVIKPLVLYTIENAKGDIGNVTGDLSAYVKKNELEEEKKSLVSKEEMNEELKNYPTKLGMSNELDNYATKELMEQGLSSKVNYSVTDDLTENINTVTDQMLTVEEELVKKANVEHTHKLSDITNFDTNQFVKRGTSNWTTGTTSINTSNSAAFRVLSTHNDVWQLFGRENKKNNSLALGFKYVDNGSTSNKVRLGFAFNDDIITFDGNRNITLDGATSVSKSLSCKSLTVNGNAIDFDNYVLKSEIPTVPDMSNYALKSDIVNTTEEMEVNKVLTKEDVNVVVNGIENIAITLNHEPITSGKCYLNVMLNGDDCTFNFSITANDDVMADQTERLNNFYLTVHKNSKTDYACVPHNEYNEVYDVQLNNITFEGVKFKSTVPTKTVMEQMLKWIESKDSSFIIK